MERLDRRLTIITTLTVLVVFCVLILRPHQVRLLSCEQRMSVAFPQLPTSLEEFPSFAASLERYFNDNLPLRMQLVGLRNLARLKLFNVADVQKVIAGNDGWLYLGNSSLAYFRNDFPFSASDLSKWVSVLEERQAWLESEGIPYMLVVAPNKGTIYPEFYPSRYNKVRPDSRLDQLESALRTGTELQFLDLRKTLMEARSTSQQPLYYRADTHWNDTGAVSAAGAIIASLKELLPDCKAISMPQVTYRPGSFTGDLAIMLNLESLLKEPDVKATVLNGRASVLVDETRTKNVEKDGARRCLISSTGRSDLPRALILRDSFTTHLQPLLSECFDEATYCWQHDLSAEMVDNRRPDIVIEVLCERFLMDPIPSNDF